MIITNTRLTDDKVSFLSPKSRLPHGLKQLLIKAAETQGNRKIIRKVVCM